MTKQPKPRGRPVKNTVKKINASPKQIAKSIFKAADKKLAQKKAV